MNRESQPASGLRVIGLDHEAMLDRVSEAVLSVDPMWRCTYANKAASALLGLDAGAITGKRLWDLLPTDADPTLFEACREAMASQVPVHGAAPHVGLDRWLNHHVYPEAGGLSILLGEVSDRPDSTRRIVGGALAAPDLEADRASAIQLEHAQRMEAVGRLAGGIAHDFNNLLTVIHANTDFTIEDLPGAHPAVASLREVLDAADRATRLTRQLLAFSRKQILNPTLLDLNAFVADAEVLLRRLLPPEITLESALAPELGAVRVDRGQLDQVLRSLVVNARDALPAGGTIAMETHREVVSLGFTWEHEAMAPGEYARVAIRDDGTGMDEATRARIFEPFFTTKPLGTGTGLGLSTAYGVIRQSGGWIRVESELGSGTTMSVLLPCVGERPPSRPGDIVTREERRGTELVLLVEDDPLVRASTRRVLERNGYRVLEAAHGLEALRVWEAQRGEIALVLTDVMMPEMGGPALVARLRELDPRVRVIFMSGYMGDDAASFDVVAAREAFVQKPFSADALAQQVRSTLDGAP